MCVIPLYIAYSVAKIMHSVSLGASVNFTVVWQRHVFAISYMNQVHRFVVHRFAASERSACHSFHKVHGTEEWMKNNIFVYLPYKYRPCIYSKSPSIAILWAQSNAMKRNEKKERRETISDKNKGKKSSGCVYISAHIYAGSRCTYIIFIWGYECDVPGMLNFGKLTTIIFR